MGAGVTNCIMCTIASGHYVALYESEGGSDETNSKGS